MNNIKLLGKRLRVIEEAVNKTQNGIVIPEKHMGHGPKVYRILQLSPELEKRSPESDLPYFRTGGRVVCYSYTEGAVDLEDGTKIINESQVVMLL